MISFLLVAPPPALPLRIPLLLFIFSQLFPSSSSSSSSSSPLSHLFLLSSPSVSCRRLDRILLFAPNVATTTHYFSSLLERLLV